MPRRSTTGWEDCCWNSRNRVETAENQNRTLRKGAKGEKISVNVKTG